MRKVIIAALAFGSLFSASSPTNAAVIIDPALGAVGSFDWIDGLGEIDLIDGLAETQFSILALAGDLISVRLEDCCVPGDELELTLNGNVVTPTLFTIGMFSYTYDRIVLSAGINHFGINVTALAPGFSEGMGIYKFSSLSAGSNGVPEPATWAMMIAGFGLVGFGSRLDRNRFASTRS